MSQKRRNYSASGLVNEDDDEEDEEKDEADAKKTVCVKESLERTRRIKMRMKLLCFRTRKSEEDIKEEEKEGEESKVIEMMTPEESSHSLLERISSPPETKIALNQE